MKVAELPLLVGSSPLILDLRQEIERVARSDAKVLCTGESGVGKEVVARAIHAASPRQHHEFVAVNCAGLPETLLESELFGHVKGSFTGAYRDKPGKLEIAHDGTLFLDEVGEMTLRMQSLLLRFLETGEIQKVGSDHSVARVDVRIVASTNRNLRDMTVRAIAERVGITERATHRILAALVEANYIRIRRIGRNNFYFVNRNGRFRHPDMAHCGVMTLLESLEPKSKPRAV